MATYPPQILSQYKVIIDLSIRGQKQSVCKHKIYQAGWLYHLTESLLNGKWNKVIAHLR